MQNVINLVLNTLFVSIPEETVWVIFTLIFLKRFDLLDKYRWKENIRWIMIPVIPTAIITNIFRYIIHVPQLAMFIIAQAIFYSLMIYIIKESTFIEHKPPYLKVLLYAFLSNIIIFVTEVIYVPLVLGIIQKTIAELNADIYLNILFSTPSRILQIIIIAFLLYGYSKNKECDIFKNIIKDKTIAIVSLVFLGVVLIVILFVVVFIGQSKLLIDLSVYLQVIIGVLMVVIPTIIICLYFIPINYLLSKIHNMQKSYQNMFNDTA